MNDDSKKIGAVGKLVGKDLTSPVGKDLSSIVGKDLTSSLGKAIAAGPSGRDLRGLLSESAWEQYLHSPIFNSRGVLTGFLGTLQSASSLAALFAQDAQDVQLARQKFEDDNIALREQIRDLATALRQEKTSAAEGERQRAELHLKLSQLEKQEKCRLLLERVNPKAQELLLRSESFIAAFSTRQELFAVSVDIRRSTDLMLSSIDAEGFASFITDLCGNLADIIKINHGVFDKFTGDGILAFFPTFLSGVDAGFLALRAADACHRAFKAHYSKSSRFFQTVREDAGLGIGIDYGECNLVSVAGGGLTIVGRPVVYACRVAGCPAGRTYLNSQAYEVIRKQYDAHVRLRRTSIVLKHEGPVTVHSARLLRDAPFQPKEPDWSAFEPTAGANDSKLVAPSNGQPKD
jgi:class 3 adenylate cyclase